MEAMLEYGVDEKHIYTDRLSGKDFNRPSYQKLMKKLKSGDLLVIKSIDRLGRDYRENLEEWRKIVKTKDVDIEVIDLPILNTTQEIDGIAGVLIADIMLSLLAYLRINTNFHISLNGTIMILQLKKMGSLYIQLKTH